MTRATSATSRPGGGRFYTWRGEKFWSVTTILSGGVPKPALINWAKKFTAEYACDNYEALGKLLETGDRDGAVDWLKGAAFRDRDRKADLGTAIHDAVESYVLRKPYPAWTLEVAPRMEAFQSFLADYGPTFGQTEAEVYNRTQAYAGRLDAIAEIGERVYLLDVKTGGKAIYPETALQLAAYRHAEFIGVRADGSEHPLPAVEACAALHLPESGGYELVPVSAGEDVFQTFLYCREVFRWQEHGSKEVIGAPLEPARLRGADETQRQLAEAVGQ